MNPHENNFGVYVHIPFCVQKCAYCDFPSYAGMEAWQNRYIAALVQEIYQQAEVFKKQKVRTVYIGGGTPTALPWDLLKKLLVTLREAFALTGAEEFTIEANPGTAQKKLFARLKTEGVQRISFGVQAFQNRLLKLLGRIHTAEQAKTAVQAAYAAGIKNISIDLIYALPQQTLQDIKQSLAIAYTLPITHLSLYSLQIEERTPFFVAQQKGCLTLPSEAEEEAMYNYLTEDLPRHGFLRYEISNYARQGFESRHNLSYWQDIPYLGLGSAAASYIDGRRFQNLPSIPAYVQAIEQGESPRREESRTEAIAMEEFAFLALRTREGIDKQAFQRRFQRTIAEIYHEPIEQLKQEGLLVENTTHLYLTSKGMKFGNRAFLAFMLDA